MLKLKNIKITDAYIEADYIPECSSECGHIKMNRVTKEIDVRSVIGFSDTYTRMAINGLERILSILQVLCKYKIVQKNLFKWTELNSVRFYIIRKISTCQ